MIFIHGEPDSPTTGTVTIRGGGLDATYRITADARFLSFSDGRVVSVRVDGEGIVRLEVRAESRLRQSYSNLRPAESRPAGAKDSDSYTFIAVPTPSWVVYGSDLRVFGT